jgi:hypothetical protein
VRIRFPLLLDVPSKIRMCCTFFWTVLGLAWTACTVSCPMQADGDPCIATITLGNVTDDDDMDGEENRNYMVLIEEVDDEDVRLYRLSTKSKTAASTGVETAGTSFKVRAPSPLLWYPIPTSWPILLSLPPPPVSLHTLSHPYPAPPPPIDTRVPRGIAFRCFGDRRR